MYWDHWLYLYLLWVINLNICWFKEDLIFLTLSRFAISLMLYRYLYDQNVTSALQIIIYGLLDLLILGLILIAIFSVKNNVISLCGCTGYSNFLLFLTGLVTNCYGVDLHLMNICICQLFIVEKLSCTLHIAWIFSILSRKLLIGLGHWDRIGFQGQLACFFRNIRGYWSVGWWRVELRRRFFRHLFGCIPWNLWILIVILTNQRYLCIFHHYLTRFIQWFHPITRGLGSIDWTHHFWPIFQLFVKHPTSQSHIR